MDTDLSSGELQRLIDVVDARLEEVCNTLLDASAAHAAACEAGTREQAAAAAGWVSELEEERDELVFIAAKLKRAAVNC